MKQSILSKLVDFFLGSKFPVFMLGAIVFYQIFLAVVTFSPAGSGLWGQFVTDFRVWCYGYDPSSGTMQWTSAWIMLTEPFLLQAIIILFWHKPLRQAIRSHRMQMIPPLSAAAVLIALIGGSLLWLGSADAAAAEELPPFPGERIRTALPLPEIELYNQYGEPIRLSDYEGEVVLLTAIYSTCATACPMLMFQARDAMNELSEKQQEDLTVMAISLDPENDSLELMAAAARAFRMDAPKFQFLNGEPHKVNTVLDRLQVARVRNAKTDEIDHASLYFLIDRQGRIAYRFNLSDRHKPWLIEALRQLLDENPPARIAEAG